MSPYRFGSFILDVTERRLLRDGAPVPLSPKVFDTLVFLVERHGHLVTKDELLEAIWAGSYVDEGSLPRTIHILRKALAPVTGEHDVHPQYVETVPTKGYRFVADVTRLVMDAAPPALPVGERAAKSEMGRKSSAPWTWRRAVLPTFAFVTLVLVGLVWSAPDPREHSTPPAPRSRPQTDSGASFAKFQKGRVHLERHLPGDIETALEEFEAAIHLDPTFAAAYAGKADAKFFRYFDSGAHDDIAQARLAVRQSIALDTNSSYARTLSCRLLGTYDWDFAGAERECRRAVALDPGNHEARRELAFLLSSTGRGEEAMQEMDAAIALAPTSFNKRSRGVLLYLERRFDEAIEQLTQVEAGDPEFRESSRWLARSLEQKGDYQTALESLVRFRESAGTHPKDITALRRAFSSGGWRGVLRISLPDRGSTPTLDAAGTFAQLGEVDRAFEVLESMINARRVMIVHMNSEPRLDPVRSDERFSQLVRRVGLR